MKESVLAARFICSLAIVVAVPGAAVPAAAEPSSEDRALATQLFREGRELLVAGNVAVACPKFAESHRLDPAGGTLLNLAMCREKEGKIATAWQLYGEALGLARRDGRADRVEVSEKSIQRLDPLVPRVTLKLPSIRVQGLKLFRDGTELPPVAWDSKIPLDPGEHTFKATAPGYVEAAVSVRLVESEQREVALPALEKLPAVEPPIPSSSAEPVSSSSNRPVPVASVYEPVPQRIPHSEPKRASWGWQKGTALGAGVVGLVGVGLATAFTIDAASKKSQSDDGCPGGKCTAVGVSKSTEALEAADRATVFAIVGGVGLGSALILWLTAPSAKNNLGGFEIIAQPSNQRAQISVSTTW